LADLDPAGAHGQGHETTLIEVMPLGEVEGDRFDHYLPLDARPPRSGSALERLTAERSDAQRRPGALCRCCRDRGGRLGFMHPAHGQLLRRLQPRARDRDGAAVHVPWR